MRLVFLIALLGALPIAPDAQALPDPVDVFIAHCYDANRLNGVSKRPASDSEWVVAPPVIRSALNIAEDPAIEAYLLTAPENDTDDDGAIVLQIHERVLENTSSISSGETRHSCQITYKGHLKSEDIHANLEEYFEGIRGFPYGNCGYQKKEGWQQSVWSIMPERGSSDWRIRTIKRKQSTCTGISHKSVYAGSELIIVRILTREEDPHTSILAIDRTFRPREQD